MSVFEPTDDKADDGGDGGDVADVMEEVAEEEDVEEVEDVAGIGMVVMDCWPTLAAPPKHTFFCFFVFVSFFVSFVLGLGGGALWEGLANQSNVHKPQTTKQNKTTRLTRLAT